MANLLRSMAKYLLSTVIFVLVTSGAVNRPSSFAEDRNKAPGYVGSEACKGCHINEYDNFSKYAKKSKSYESIERVKKGLTDEEIKGCYYCHTTGYGKPSGFVSVEKTPYLRNAGCEVCHGPGEFHIKTKSQGYKEASNDKRLRGMPYLGKGKGFQIQAYDSRGRTLNSGIPAVFFYFGFLLFHSK